MNDPSNSKSSFTTSFSSESSEERATADRLSERATRLLNSLPKSNSAHSSIVLSAYQQPFSANNPDGWINLSTAENSSCSSLILAALNHAPPLSSIDLCYTYMHGSPSCRAAVAHFLSSRIYHTPVDPEHLILAAGAAAVLDHVAFSLCGEGDFILTPTPVYPGFLRDFGTRAGIKMCFAPCKASDGFRVTADLLEKGWRTATVEVRSRIRACVISNPGNPTGLVLGKEELRSIVDWCRGKRIHFVCDEIYALCAHDDEKCNPETASSGNESSYSSQFVSVSSVCTMNSDVHAITGFAKDLGLSGMRIGVLYSKNESLLAASSRCSFLSAASSTSQQVLCALLDPNSDFIDMLITEMRLCLAQNKRILSNALDGLGIPYVAANAGLFLWVDMRKFIAQFSPLVGEEAEIALLEYVARRCKVALSPGHSYNCIEAGWFRICFSAVEPEVLRNVWSDRLAPALERLLAG